jgi:hypothetical protein
MADMQTDINRILNDFAVQLLAVFREAVVTSLGGGAPLSQSPPANAPKRRGRPPKSASAMQVAPAANHKGRKRGPKSSQKEVEALQAQILDALKGGAKITASEMIRTLMVDPGPFHYALNKLKKSLHVSQIGQRRSAKYALGISAKKSARKKTTSGDAGADAQV